jgi:hypothetical protein
MVLKTIKFLVILERAVSVKEWLECIHHSSVRLLSMDGYSW